MRILLLSDLNWHANSKKISRQDILMLYETGQPGLGDRFRSIRKYWDLIKVEAANVLLFLGDVTGDGSCGHGYHTAFYYLLVLCDITQQPTYFIQGDNDLDQYFVQVTSNLNVFSHVHWLSGGTHELEGLRVLGIPYSVTSSKKELADLINRNRKRYHDLIICHSPLKRRTHLLELPCAILATGHFDNKLIHFDNKIYLSHSNDSSLVNYSVLTKKNGAWITSYKITDTSRRILMTYTVNPDGKTDLRLGMVPFDILEFEKLPLTKEQSKSAELAMAMKFLRSPAYKEAIKYMHVIKEGKAQLKRKKLAGLMAPKFTPRHSLSRSMLFDYLGYGVKSYL